MSENDSDRYRAPALDKGLDILELLAEEEAGLTQAEIAKRLDRGASEFYRMLDRLVKRGYVSRMDGDRFALSLKLFGLAQRHAPIRRLTSFAVPVMRDLAEATRQANQLVVFDRGNPVVVAQQEAPGYWGISIRVGSRIGLFDTGSGHVLLAFRSQRERERMIAEHLGNRAHGWGIDASFFDRLEAVRAEGHERMPSAQTAGVTNLSTPVLGADGKAIAALTIPYLPLINVPDAPDMEGAVTALKAASRALSVMSGAEDVVGTSPL
ncbi:IclR family transcriptional regulator [Rhizobium sp. SG2393]|uniref:IclR family transcriptional regulator n=1 Tax=Rhizobium sp. SG2393 TaxID=3276279 RepID=UPI00367010FE